MRDEMPKLNFMKASADSDVLIVTLDRADKRNALSTAFIEEIVGLFDWVRRTDAVRAVVVKAEGSVFCAGLDLIEHHMEDRSATDFMYICRRWHAAFDSATSSTGSQSRPAATSTTVAYSTGSLSSSTCCSRLRLNEACRPVARSCASQIACTRSRCDQPRSRRRRRIPPPSGTTRARSLKRDITRARGDVRSTRGRRRPGRERSRR